MAAYLWLYTMYLTRFRTYKIALPPKQKPRRGGGLRRILRVHTEWRLLISGVHPIMMENPACPLGYNDFNNLVMQTL